MQRMNNITIEQQRSAQYELGPIVKNVHIGAQQLVNVLRQDAVFFLLIAVICVAEAIKLGWVGQVNRAPISWQQAFMGSIAYWAFTFILYKPLVNLVERRPINSLSSIKCYATPLICYSVLMLIWGLFSDYLTIPGTPFFTKIFVNRMLYDLGSIVLFIAMLMLLLSVSRQCQNKVEQKQPIEVTRKQYIVKKGTENVVVNAKDIIAVKAQDYYAELLTQNDSFLLRMPVKKLYEELEHLGMVRLSRSAFARVDCINATQADDNRGYKALLNNGVEIKIAKSQVRPLLNKLAA